MPTALELGMQALQEGQASRAASFFEFALKKAPSDPAIRLMAVDAYIQAGMFLRAEPHVRHLLDHSDSLYQRGEYEMLARARTALCQIDKGLGRGNGESAGAETGPPASGKPGPRMAPQLRAPGQPADAEPEGAVAVDLSGMPMRRAAARSAPPPATPGRSPRPDPLPDPLPPVGGPPAVASEAAGAQETEYLSAPGDPSIIIGAYDSFEAPAVDLSSASDYAAIEAHAELAAAQVEPVVESVARPRVVACPWCGKTVLLDANFAGRCQCDWFQPARGSRLYISDLQRLCAHRRGAMLIRVHQDLFMLDGADVRLRLIGRKAIKVDPRLAFELDLGHAILYQDQVKPILPQVHPTAVFRLFENYNPDVLGTETFSEGQFYSFSEMIDRLEIEYPDCLGLMTRDIHYQYQLSKHLGADLKQKADEQLEAGARSYGRCLIAAGMSMEDLLRMVPGWQVLRPIGGGHGRLEGVRSLIRKGFITEEEATAAISKARGRDAIAALVEAKLITREVAEDVLADLTKQMMHPPLRDDIMERLCRRGVISRVTLVRAGLVLGLVDFDAGADEGGLAGAMSQIPPDEIEHEKKLLAKKDTLRRSERLALGKILMDLGFCTRQTVSAALARQVREDSPLGEMLVNMLAITPEQLTVALAEQEQRMEALISPRTEPGSEGPPPQPFEPAESLAPAQEAEAAPADREAKAEKKASAAETPAKKRKSGKSRREEGLPRVALLAGGGLAVLALAVGVTLLLLNRPKAPGEEQTLPPARVGSLVPATEAGSKPRSQIEAPWRDPDGRLLDPVAQTDPAQIRAEISRIQLERFERGVAPDAAADLRLARLFHSVGDRPRRDAMMEAALRRHPDNPNVLVQAAFLRLEDGSIGGALSHARKALEAAPDDPLAHVALGAVWLAGSNDYEAEREFDLARALDPRLIIEAQVSLPTVVATGGVGVAAPGVRLSVKVGTDKSGAPPAASGATPSL